jgi:hypothetical protein
MKPTTWSAYLLAWCAEHYPEEHREFRGLRRQQGALIESELARIEAGWFRWASREWARWDNEARATIDAQVAELQDRGLDAREALKRAWLEREQQRAA